MQQTCRLGAAIKKGHRLADLEQPLRQATDQQTQSSHSKKLQNTEMIIHVQWLNHTVDHYFNTFVMCTSDLQLPLLDMTRLAMNIHEEKYSIFMRGWQRYLYVGHFTLCLRKWSSNKGWNCYCYKVQSYNATIAIIFLTVYWTLMQFYFFYTQVKFKSFSRKSHVLESLDIFIKTLNMPIILVSH